MEHHRRPPHYYGLPSQAPRVRPETTPAASSEQPDPVAPPTRRLKRPEERFPPESELPARKVQGSATEPPAANERAHRAHPAIPAHGTHPTNSTRSTHGTHVRVPPGAALRATQPNYVNRLPADDETDPLSPAGRPGAAGPPRLKRRRKKRRRPRVSFLKRLRRAAPYLSTIVLLALIVGATTAPQFKVAAVDVPRDLTVTPPAAIAAAASALVGQNWFRAGTRVATNRLRALPMVRDASIVRELRWPPRLELQIDERKPFARVGAGERWWVVDETGVPFRSATASDDTLNAVTGRGLSPKLGTALPHDAWGSVLQFTRALNQDNRRGEAWEVERIYFDNFGNASLRLADSAHNKMLLRLGGDRWNDKLTRARASLAYFAETNRDPEVLDLRSYMRPLWKPRSAAASGANAGGGANGEKADATPDQSELPAGQPAPKEDAPANDPPDLSSRRT